MKVFKKVANITFDLNKDFNNKAVKVFIFAFTELGSSFGIGIIFLIVAILNGYKLLFAFVPIYLLQLTIVEIIKFLLRRPRPRTNFKENLWGIKLSSGSFPSGHTSNIFTAAFLVSNYYRLSIIPTIGVFIVAGTVALSRVFLGKHYILDIVGGALLGLVISVLGGYWLGFLKIA